MPNDKSQDKEKPHDKDNPHDETPRERIAVQPRIGDYFIPINLLLQRTLGCKTMEPPVATKKTVEIGAKYSPDTVCTPYKITLGTFMEALNKGANTIVMPAIGCRLGFYDILQEQVLRDMGYDFEMMQMFDYIPSEKRLYESMERGNPNLTHEIFDEAFALLCKVVVDMDELAAYIRKNRAFEVKKGEMTKAYKQYLAEVRTLKDIKAATELGDKYRKIVYAIKIDKPEKVLRIGLVGDLYSLIEPHGNCEIESWLGSHGVEINRRVDLTYLAKYLIDFPTLTSRSGGYCNYNIGGSANGTIMHGYEMAKEGIDGIIHMKAATCTPEITAMSILQNISKDFDVPIIYLTFDTETSEAGLHTRLEAFIDMLSMKKEREKAKEKKDKEKEKK